MNVTQDVLIVVAEMLHSTCKVFRGQLQMVPE
jgi:hypothetical protein